MPVAQGMTKHQRILETVKQQIESGEYLPGHRLPTDLELVKHFDASRPTVAKALQELEKRGMIVRRPGSGTYVQFTENTLRFGLLIPGLGTTEIFGPICAEMARAAKKHQHSLLWGANSPANATPEVRTQVALELAAEFCRDKVGGVFFAPLELIHDKDDVNQRIIQQFNQANIPIVLLDRDFAVYPERSHYDLVGIDNRRAGYVVTNHLIQQGCQRLLFAAKPRSAPTIESRIAGFAEAMLKNDLPLSAQSVFRWNSHDLRSLSERLKQDTYDGIVCGNDATAGEILIALNEIGYDVPKQIKVTGIDDVEYAKLLRVPLTTVRQPCTEIGEVAFQVMLDRLSNPQAPYREINLSCELVVRESTR